MAVKDCVAFACLYLSDSKVCGVFIFYGGRN